MIEHSHDCRIEDRETGATMRAVGSDPASSSRPGSGPGDRGRACTVASRLRDVAKRTLCVQLTRLALPGYRLQAIIRGQAHPCTVSDVAAILVTACIPRQTARSVECNSVAPRHGKSVPQGSWLPRYCHLDAA